VRHGPVGFDLDLTLIDSRPGLLATWAEFADETRIAVDLDAIDRRGFSTKLEEELLHWVPADEVAPAAATYRRLYARHLEDGSEALPGAHDALSCVEEAGESPVVVTAKHGGSVQPCLDATGLRPHRVFSFVHGPEKSDVLRRIGASIYVGDTQADMVAAVDGGTVAVGVTTGSFDEDALRAAGAAHVLSSLVGFRALYRALRSGAQPPNGSSESDTTHME
jgi:phosphoglycolate phosphatase